MTECLATNPDRAKFEAVVIAPIKELADTFPNETQMLCDEAEIMFGKLTQIAAQNWSDTEKHICGAGAYRAFVKVVCGWHNLSVYNRIELIAEADKATERFFRECAPDQTVTTNSIIWIRRSANTGKLDEIDAGIFADVRMAAVFWCTPAPLLGFDQDLYAVWRRTLALRFSPAKESYVRAADLERLTDRIVSVLCRARGAVFDPVTAGLDRDYLPFELNPAY